MYKSLKDKNYPGYLDDQDDFVDQNQEKSQDQNDQGYLGDSVDQMYKIYKKSSVTDYLNDLDDCVDQNQENK